MPTQNLSTHSIEPEQPTSPIQEEDPPITEPLDYDSDASWADIYHDNADDAPGYIDSSSLPLFDASDHFFKHLSEGLFCPSGHHDRLWEKHRNDLRAAGQSHRDCIGIAELAHQLDPRMPRNRHIPDFLGKSYVYRGDEVYTSPNYPVKHKPDLTIQARQLKATTLKKMFEGTANHDSQPPKQVCMFLEDHSYAHRPPTITVDVDSICGRVRSTAAFRKGWSFFPLNNLVMSSKVHGIRLPIYDTDGTCFDVAPEEIPHVHVGKLGSWSFINVYFLFPRIWLSRRKDLSATPYLTDEQRRTLYDKVLYAAFESTLPSTDLGALPATYDIALSNALAASTERGIQTQDSGSRLQLLSIEIRTQYSHAFSVEVQRCITRHNLTDFYDMQIFFIGKGMKDSTRSNSYSELYRRWNEIWEEQINDRHIRKNEYWIDLGRQFAPGSVDNPESRGDTEPPEDPPRVLLWKPCCLKRYYDARTKRFGHGSGMPLVRHQLAGLRDVISITMTASSNSPQATQGAPHSVFYSKTKTGFVTNAIEIFQSPHIDVLPYGQAHLLTVASEGNARTPSLEAAPKALIHGMVRADRNLEAMADLPAEAREEHRQRGDVFHDVLPRLVELESTEGVLASTPEPGPDPNECEAQIEAHMDVDNDNVGETTTSYQRHLETTTNAAAQEGGNSQQRYNRSLPFWTVNSEVFAAFLRGNLNKACMGFEVVLRDINSQFVEQALTATGLIFLKLARFGVLSKSPSLAPELYRDKWKPVPKKRSPKHSTIQYREPSTAGLSDEDEGDDQVCEGLGMAKNMKKYGYSWIAPGKIDWTTWRIDRDHVQHFFRSEPAFALAMRKRRQQVLTVYQALKVVEILREWLMLASTRLETDAILDFATGFIMVSYRHAIWAQLDQNGVLKHLPINVRKPLLDGRVPVTFSNIATYVRDKDPIAPDHPVLKSSNSSFHQGDPNNILEYLFGTVEPYVGPRRGVKKRDNWKNRLFRQLFAQVRQLLSSVLPPDQLRAWNQELYHVIHATNPLLPNPDGTGLISRRHSSEGYGWLAYQWLNGLGPFLQPVSCRQLVQQVYPPGVTKITEFCKRNIEDGGVFFDSEPPRLKYEDEFFEKSIPHIKRKMAEKWAAFKSA